MTDIASVSMIDRTIAQRYYIFELVGFGGFSEIYKAVDKNTGRTVAIKLLKNELRENVELSDSFESEIDLLKRLDHPLIVNLLHVGRTDDGRRFIVLEYVDGKSLKELIKMERQLSERDTIDIALSILKALKYSHRTNILHGDIKPQNVMVGQDYIKLTDFGAARLNLSSLQHDLDKKEGNFGSVHYCSPEHVLDLPLIKQSDIYSLGIVMYEMLTGSLPFDGTLEEIISRHKDTRPKKPSELKNGISKQLENIVMKALEKKPEQRFQSAEDMEKALEDLKCLKTEKIQAKQHEPGKIARRIKKINKTKLLVYIVSLACFLSFFGFTIAMFDKLLNETYVPYVIGELEDEAKRIILNSKLTPIVTRRSHENMPAGLVVSQSVAYGEKMRSKSVLNIVVSTGADKQAVPDLLGYSFAEAKDILERLGFKAKKGKVLLSQMTVDSVEKQSRKPGDIMEFGSEIVLDVSGGSFSMPNLVGLSKKDAVDTLARLGISKEKIEISEVKISDNSQIGRVASQSPEEKTLHIPVDEKLKIILAVYVQGGQ